MKLKYKCWDVQIFTFKAEKNSTHFGNEPYSIITSSSSSSSSFICQEHIQHNVQEEQIAHGKCDKAKVQHE